MGGEWRSKLVADLQRAGVLLVEDGNHGEYRPRPDEFVESGVAFIRAADMDGGRVLFESVAKINEQARGRIRKGIGAPGDVLLSHKGTVGKVALVQNDAPAFVCSPQTTFWRTLDERQIDRKYLFAFLRSSVFHAQLATRAGETDMAPYVSLTSQRRLSVVLPPLPEQRAIAHILGTLDDKIELNRRMNETLEAMARALFKSWFVDFDPVRAKCRGEPMCSPQFGQAPHSGQAPKSDHAPQSGQARRPAPTEWPQHILDLFPDRLVDSELGEIPEGWRVGTLKDRSSLNPETWSKKTRPPTINYVDLSNTKWGRIEVVTKYPQEEAPSRAQRVLRPGDTIVGTVRPGNGSYAFVSEDGLTGSTGFAALRPTRAEFAEFVYLAATQRENIEALSHLADGGAYPAVRPDAVAETQIVGANADVLKQFSRYTGPLLAKAAQNRREARTLTSLRDTLLPELISGELRLQSANIGTEQWQWRRN